MSVRSKINSEDLGSLKQIRFLQYLLNELLQGDLNKTLLTAIWLQQTTFLIENRAQLETCFFSCLHRFVCCEFVYVQLTGSFKPFRVVFNYSIFSSTFYLGWFTTNYSQVFEFVIEHLQSFSWFEVVSGKPEEKKKRKKRCTITNNATSKNIFLHATFHNRLPFAAPMAAWKNVKYRFGIYRRKMIKPRKKKPLLFNKKKLLTGVTWDQALFSFRFENYIRAAWQNEKRYQAQF